MRAFTGSKPLSIRFTSPSLPSLTAPYPRGRWPTAGAKWVISLEPHIDYVLCLPDPHISSLLRKPCLLRRSNNSSCVRPSGHSSSLRADDIWRIIDTLWWFEGAPPFAAGGGALWQPARGNSERAHHCYDLQVHRARRRAWIARRLPAVPYYTCIAKFRTTSNLRWMSI
jgi:hypothetical protein